MVAVPQHRDASRELHEMAVVDASGRDDHSCLHPRVGQIAPAVVIGVEDAPSEEHADGAASHRVEEHPAGHHGFDVVDADERSRELIAMTLDYMVERLEARW
jgi:hypothetical protein